LSARLVWQLLCEPAFRDWAAGAAGHGEDHHCEVRAMSKQHFVRGAALTAAAVVLLFIPAKAMAQRGHGPTGHALGGAYHAPAYHPYYGGYHYGYYHPHYYGGYGYGYYPYRYYGIYAYAGPYFNYPYSYVYTAPNYYVYPSSTVYVPYVPNYFTSGSGIYSSGYEPLAPAESAASVELRLPVPDAQVWFDGTATTQTGIVRTFTTPSLTPGIRYSYQVRAKWTADGKEVEQTRSVKVEAGEPVVIDFTQPVSETLPRPRGQ
jgi:uncharacterized protein (TIGR03000 family)